jgi:hypothetical protein
MRDYRRGFGLLQISIHRLQVVTTNNYNIVAICTLYSSLQHSLQCSQSVTRHFLITAPTIASGSSPLFTESCTDYQINLSLTYNISARNTWLFHCSSSSVVALLRICCLATRTYLPSCCLETCLVYQPISLSFIATAPTRYNTIINYLIPVASAGA